MAVNSFNAQNPPVTTKGDVFTFSTIPTRLAVGSNNTVLTADSSTATGLKWATPSTYNPSFTLINAGGTALTGATTITISGISGYSILYFVIDRASSVNVSATFRIRLNGDTGANYNTFGSAVTGQSTYSAQTVVGQGTSTGATYFEDIGQMSSNAASRVAGGGFIQGCNSSGIKMLVSMTGASGDDGVGHKVVNNVGYYTGTSTISSFSLLSSSGNFDNGTLYVWGA